MPDPLSVVVLAAGIGGASGKLVEKSIDAGAKWIGSFMKDHQPAAQLKAKENYQAFLLDLAMRVKFLEDAGVVSQQKILDTQDEPDFAVALQAALITASQTESKEKHMLLAAILSKRLEVDAESLASMACKIALGSIAYATPGQLKILAVVCIARYLRPNWVYSDTDLRSWLTERLSPFAGLQCTQIDLLHLESISCLKYTGFWATSLGEVIYKQEDEAAHDLEFLNSEVGQNTNRIWTSDGLESSDLTSVGQLIGLYVSNILSGENSQLEGWYENI